MGTTMSTNGRSFEVDESGYLVDIHDWNRDIAIYLAATEGIALSDQHWEVVNFLRDYYKKYRIAPMIKILVRAVEKTFGPEKGNSKYLYELLPNGPAKQACRIAGLPRPSGCV